MCDGLAVLLVVVFQALGSIQWCSLGAFGVEDLEHGLQ